MIIKQVVQAIKENQESLGIKGFFHNFNPDFKNFPFITYTVVSDVPALTADNEEIESRITVRLHIVTQDGAYNEIYKKLNRIMLDLSFMRVQAAEITDNGLKIKAIDYRIGVNV